MERKEDIGRMHTAGITIDFEYGELWRGLHRSNPLSFKKPFSFVVYKDRDKYMAEDWRGRIRFEDDDAYLVIQSALDNGRGVFLRAGAYELSDTLVVDYGRQLIGESTRLTRLVSPSGKYAIKIESSVGWARHMVVRDLYIDGNGRAGSGIQINIQKDLVVERIWIYSCDIGVEILTGWGITLDKVYATYCNYGLRINDTSVGGRMCRVINSLFRDSQYDNVIATSDSILGVMFKNVISERSGRAGAGGYGFNLQGGVFELINVHAENNPSGDVNIGTGVTVKILNDRPLTTSGADPISLLISTNGNYVFNRLAIPTSPPPNPEAGSMYFDSSTGTLYIYDGSAWKSVTLT